MYEVTNLEKQAYKSQGSIKRGYISIVPLSNEEPIILDESNIKNFEILDDIYTPDEGIIGSTIAKQVTLNLFKPSDIDLINREIDVNIGVEYIENGTNKTKYIPYGRYIIQKPDNQVLTESTYFEALDFMIKFNIPFEDTLTYPCKLKKVYEAILEQSGVSAGTTSFTNEDFIVDSNQFVSGESCRDVLMAICQMSGTYAHIGRDNKLYLLYPNGSSVGNFNDTDYTKDIKVNNVYGPVNRLVLRMSQVEGENVVRQDDASISQYGLKELIISDNPFTYTQEKREQAITAIWNKVRGLTYVDYEMKVVPRPYMDVGDKHTIQYNDETIETILMTHRITFNGGLKGEMSCTADTETETKYAFRSELANRLRHTEIVVNKATGEITAIAETVEETIKEVKEELAPENRFERQKEVSIQCAEATLDDVTMYGELEQATRDGLKNKLNPFLITTGTANGVTCTFDKETQTFTFNGTCTVDDTRFGTSAITINYTTNKTKMIGYYVSGSVSGYAKFRSYTSSWGDGELLDLAVLSSSNSKVILTSTYTIAKSIHNFRFNNGTVLNNFKIKVMITDSDDTDFEPYGVMPSPDFPSPIKVVGDNINIFDGEFRQGTHVSTTTTNRICSQNIMKSKKRRKIHNINKSSSNI